MVKIDLVTGFLGSGKTTFLKKYAQHLMGQGIKVGILENDHGAVNVDMMLLQELSEDLCAIEMIIGGCDLETHMRRFKTKLIALKMWGCQRVLVEPSGIFDVDEFFDVLREEPLDQWYEIGSVITVVDSKLENELSARSEYLLASQLADAGKIVLSKTQEASEGEIEATKEHLNRVMERFGNRRRFANEIISKNWDDLTDEDFDSIANAGCKLTAMVKMPVDIENDFKSLYYFNVHMPVDELVSTVEGLLDNPAAGGIFRIKGFLPLPDETWVEINVTHRETTIRPIEKGQEIIIVIGEDLDRDVIGEVWAPYINA